MKSLLPHWAYLTAGSIHGGAMTGVTEVSSFSSPR
jgi:hypothetical protein